MPNFSSPYRVGSLYLVPRGVYFHIQGTHEGKRYRFATRCTDLTSAKRALDDFSFSLTSGWRSKDGTPDEQWHAVAKTICQRHRTHSKARGIPFNIDAGYVYRLMQEAGFVCAVSGVPLSRTPTLYGQPDPWGPSIDRIENRHGYLRGNVRIVSLAANLAMNRWGYDVLLRLANAVVANAARPIHEKLAGISHNDASDQGEVVVNIEDFAEMPSSRWGGVARSGT